MTVSSLIPLVELTRGPLVESIHIGALAVVDSQGNLVASAGDPYWVTNLRSSSKPFQTLPLIEKDGPEFFGLTEREIAITCASHMGTDEHVAVLEGMHQKIGLQESDLQCGIHPPEHEPTLRAMQERGETPTPFRHNCSGKHTGMLAQAILAGLPIDTYLRIDHPVQQQILKTFAEMVGLKPEEVLIGIDGCSAPTFAVPLYNAALGFARLADPRGMPEKRATALRRIASAMVAHPDMVSGPGGFDTRLMMAGRGKVVSKCGAEGYVAVGILPGVLAAGSPGLGLAVKVIDGDALCRARSVTVLHVLRQLGALSDSELEEMSGMDQRPIYNWRHLEVGAIRPAFTLDIKQPAG